MTENGQCKCFPGVIGKNCDQCPEYSVFVTKANSTQYSLTTQLNYERGCFPCHSIEECKNCNEDKCPCSKPLPQCELRVNILRFEDHLDRKIKENAALETSLYQKENEITELSKYLLDLMCTILKCHSWIINALVKLPQFCIRSLSQIMLACFWAFFYFLPSVAFLLQKNYQQS